MVRRLKYLSTKEGREEHSLLLLEGTHLLQEVLKANFFPQEIILTRKWIEKNPDLMSSLSEKTLIHQVTPSVLKSALTTVQPDGVATICRLNLLPTIKQIPNFILALDRLQDPGNVGSLIRTALAADVEAVWFAAGADPLGQKVIRASAGAILHLPFIRFNSSETIAVEKLARKLQEASRSGFQVLAALVPELSSDREICPYWEVDWIKPTVLLLGNEGSGLHPSLKACSTKGITLPHSEVVESLNVAASAVPLLMERRRVKMTTEIQQRR